MSDNLTRTSLNFEFVRRINTDLTPFDIVLYFFKDNDNMIVEDPNSSKAYITWKNEIKKYIQLGDIETPWEKTFDGSYIKIKDQHLHQIVPIKNKLELVHLKFWFNMFNDDIHMVRTIKEKNFKVYKKYSEKRKDQGLLKVSAYVPIWPMWAKISRKMGSSDSKNYSISKIYMRDGDQFYRFPYGNVNGSDGICFGGSNRNSFETPEEMWINFITTPFNTDYEFNVRANNIKDPRYGQRRSVSRDGRSRGIAPVVINVPTFNLEEIPVRMAAKAYKHISFIDVLYYLTHITDFDELRLLDVFFKTPKNPWEEEKE